MAWIVRVVKIGAEGEGPATDVMEINRFGDLADIANLGLPWPKRSDCWPASNRRLSQHRSGVALSDSG